MITKHVKVYDDFGYPVEGVHVTYGVNGTVTNQNGCATVQGLFFGNEWVTFSHISFKNQSYPISNIPNDIYLESEAIQGDEVIITSTPKTDPAPIPVVIKDKNKPYLQYILAGISIIGFLASLSGNDEPKPVKAIL